VKGDPKRAEEYYSRAMLADPSDGEIMSQYAKLAWEAHHDRERSLRYFHKSVQAAPQNRSLFISGLLYFVQTAQRPSTP
jgi:Tfp pilus assembly protein PilF